MMDTLGEDEIQALIVLAELRDPIETPNNNHYRFYPSSVQEAQTYFRRFALPLENAFATLAQKGFARRHRQEWSPTGEGKRLADEHRRLRPPIWYWYRDFYTAIETSAAFSTYAERVFGKNMGQHGFSDLDQIRLVLDQVKLVSGSRVLDIGCGNGKTAEHISDLTGATVTGVDYVPEAIEQAMRRTEDRRDRLLFLVGNLDALDLGDETFDLILSIDSIFFGQDLVATISRLARMLAPDGQMAAFYGCDLGPALEASGLTYREYDLSRAHYEHMQLKYRVASEMREAFEREGNAFVWENLVRESFKDQAPFEQAARIVRRCLYIAGRR